MSISRFYTKEVSVKGLVNVGATDKEIFSEKIASLFCRMEPQGQEPVMLGDGAFYNLFMMWCEKGEVDIEEGDQVVDSDSIIYIVKGISEFKRATETAHHLEILLAVPK